MLSHPVPASLSSLKRLILAREPESGAMGTEQTSQQRSHTGHQSRLNHALALLRFSICVQLKELRELLSTRSVEIASRSIVSSRSSKWPIHPRGLLTHTTRPDKGCLFAEAIHALCARTVCAVTQLTQSQSFSVAQLLQSKRLFSWAASSERKSLRTPQ
eukprot:6206434-Pleurochrysis_carterae.AAC.1